MTASVRSPLAPQIPSLPPAATAKLATLFSEITRSPEMRQKMFQQGWTVVGTTAEGPRLHVKSDTALLGGIIASQGIKID